LDNFSKHPLRLHQELPVELLFVQLVLVEVALVVQLVLVVVEVLLLVVVEVLLFEL